MIVSSMICLSSEVVCCIQRTYSLIAISNFYPLYWTLDLDLLSQQIWNTYVATAFDDKILISEKMNKTCNPKSTNFISGEKGEQVAVL